MGDDLSPADRYSRNSADDPLAVGCRGLLHRNLRHPADIMIYLYSVALSASADETTYLPTITTTTAT